MAERDAPYFKVTHDHEKNISIGDARRAIYIDFEGFEKELAYQVDATTLGTLQTVGA